MAQQEDPMIENRRRLLEQHWLHCRHIESERAWFMNVYAVIVGGLLAYYFTGNVRELWLLYFLIVLTVIGFLLTWRWKHAFQYHQVKVEETTSALGVPVDLNVPANHIWKIFRTRYLFIYFYLIVFVLLIVLVVITNLCKG